MNLLTPVSSLMSTGLITITVHTPLREAAELLRTHEIHHLPVVDPSGKIEGIVSQSDFLKLAGTPPEQSSVSDIMTSGLAKLEPSDTLRTAASLFAMNRFHALPVIQNGKLAGILTTLDLIRFMDRETPQLSDYRN